MTIKTHHMKKRLLHTTTILAFLLFSFIVQHVNAQQVLTGIDGVGSITDPYIITDFPTTLSNVNSKDNGYSATGMNGSCFTIPCCSVMVAKIITPKYGSLRADNHNFQAVSASIIGYVPNNENVTTWTDLDFLSGPGNFCGFKDRLELGTYCHWPSKAWEDDATNKTKIYLHGEIEKSFTDNQDHTSLNNRFSLGQEFDGSTTSNFLDGSMTEFSFWDEVLTQSEIKMLMESAITSDFQKYDNLIGYFPMNVNCADNLTTMTDVSGNDYSGLASSVNIQSDTALLEINGFNAANHYIKSWKKDGSEIAVTETLSVEGILSNAGNYQLDLIRDIITISDDFEIIVNASPEISKHPSNKIKPIGSDVTFSVLPNNPAYSYEWFEKKEGFSSKKLADGLGHSFSADIAFDNNKIYNLDNGISISNDNAETFTNYSANIWNSSTGREFFVSGDTIYVAVHSGGLYGSYDDGATFNAISLDNYYSYNCNGVSKSGGKVYVSMWTGVGLFVSNLLNYSLFANN